MSGPRKQKQRTNTLSEATYYGVLSCAALVGLMAYTAGATLEGVLLRAGVTLLACTFAGYLLNLVLLMAAARDEGAPAERTAPTPQHVNLTVGDDQAAA